jgi:hypothetical protein
MFSPSLLGLYYCSFGDSGQIGLGLGSSHSTRKLLPRLVPCIPGSRIFQILVRHKKYVLNGKWQMVFGNQFFQFYSANQKKRSGKCSEWFKEPFTIY